MIEIKTLTNSDFNEYKRLVSTVNEEFTQDSHYSQTMTDTLIHDILNQGSPKCIVFGCYENEALIATAALEQIRYVGKEHKSLIKYNFVTNNDKSINSELINFIINYARQNNYESLLTSIVSNNIGAKVFYSALGFDILGFEKNAIKIGNTYFDEHWLFYDLINK
ncbi:TPA: GNAT family N-acetyltransferase [Staphylococcus aureus]|nr:GNAT family N-acetyltransferase [Staphylococcus aureus]HDH1814251.1 GNAT family N-acetyltransferase [Staphylococcus aureus]HDH2384193.1 GNAT family N-acetyltransferase [Staphylococcus aureus]HDH2397155.1 GNAT family N-acetyltransferase [Staphylococcus aureus]